MLKAPIIFGGISSAAAYYVFDASKRNTVIAGVVAASILFLAIKYIHPITVNTNEP